MASQHRRNFLPAFIINIVLWAITLLVVFKVSPDYYLTLSVVNLRLVLPLSLIGFLALFALSLTLTLALLLGHTRRGFFLALFVSGLLVLQLIKQATLINMTLLLALFLSTEIYFSSRKGGKDRPKRLWR